MTVLNSAFRHIYLFVFLLGVIGTDSVAEEYTSVVVNTRNQPNAFYHYYIVSTEAVRQHLARNGVPGGGFAPSISSRNLQKDSTNERRCQLEFALASTRMTIELGEQTVRNWYYRSGNELADLNGDGFFDSRRLNGWHSQIRLREKLLDVGNKRGISEIRVLRNEKIARDFSLPLPDAPRDKLDKVYVFRNEQWTDQWQERVANDIESNAWVFPKIQTTPLPETSEIQRLAALHEWNPTYAGGPSVALFPLDKNDKQGDMQNLKLTTDFGHEIELQMNRQGQVIHLQFKNIYEERVSYDDRGHLLASEFRIGDFRYVDSDGDRVFESFHDQKRKNWFLLRADDLLAVGPPSNSQLPTEFPDKSDKTLCHRLENHVWIDAQIKSP